MMKFIRDRRGASLVEYIILVGVVALMSIVAFRQFGYKVRDKVDSQNSAVKNDIENE